MYHLNTVKKITFLAATIILSGCSDSNLQESGGGAGDGSGGPGNPDAIALIQPFTGVYDLQDDWNGQAGDQAFLSIREPDSNGVAEAIFFDIDDIDNCVPRPVTGEVRKDFFSDRIFLDDILDLNESVLTLSGSTLTIELADEVDRDGDGNLTEEVQVLAVRVGMTELDLGPACL